MTQSTNSTKAIVKKCVPDESKTIKRKNLGFLDHSSAAQNCLYSHPSSCLNFTLSFNDSAARSMTGLSSEIIIAALSLHLLANSSMSGFLVILAKRVNLMCAFLLKKFQNFQILTESPFSHLLNSNFFPPSTARSINVSVSCFLLPAARRSGSTSSRGKNSFSRYGLQTTLSHGCRATRRLWTLRRL